MRQQIPWKLQPGVTQFEISRIGQLVHWNHRTSSVIQPHHSNHKKLLQSSQLGPTNPGSHKHLTVASTTLQTPPFLQGFGSHPISSVSQFFPGKQKNVDDRVIKCYRLNFSPRFPVAQLQRYSPSPLSWQICPLAQGLSSQGFTKRPPTGPAQLPMFPLLTASLIKSTCLPFMLIWKTLWHRYCSNVKLMFIFSLQVRRYNP